MALREPRRYHMGLRAASKADTEQRILTAAVRLFLERAYDAVRLEDVAEAAGVSAPTVIHRFGSKEGLVAAATRVASEEVVGQRSRAVPGDIAGAVKNLIEHYERWGDATVHLLSQEVAVPVIREVTDAGRAVHVEWVERTFAPWLAKGRARHRRLAQLVALMDVAVWKVMRRDRRLSRAETETAMHELVSAVLEKYG